MLTLTTYQTLQRTFFCRVTDPNNRALVTLEIPEMLSAGSFTDFTGEDDELAVESYTMQCLYKRRIDDKARKKFGIEEKVSTLVYISPLQLKKLTGSEFLDPKIMANQSRIRVKLFNVSYLVTQIVEHEPMEHNGRSYAISYEFRLSKD